MLILTKTGFKSQPKKSFKVLMKGEGIERTLITFIYYVFKITVDLHGTNLSKIIFLHQVQDFYFIWIFPQKLPYKT